MLETSVDSCNKAVHVYATALSGTRDRIQESSGTKLLHTSHRRVSVDKGQGACQGEGESTVSYLNIRNVTLRG
jgi:hypothetical protein